jgi:hypothetical protein
MVVVLSEASLFLHLTTTIEFQATINIDWQVNTQPIVAFSLGFRTQLCLKIGAHM